MYGVKVIHVCQRDDASTGGAARVAAALVPHLQSPDVHARLLFLSGEPGPIGADIRSQCDYLALGRRTSPWIKLQTLQRHLRQEGVNLLHHHDGLAWTHVAGRMAGLPAVGHGHLFANARKPTLKTELTNWIHRHTYKRLFAVSSSVAESWRAKGYPADQVVVVPNAVDANQFRLPSECQKREARSFFSVEDSHDVVLFVGRLDNQMKGCDEFLQVIAELPSRYVGLVVGDGPDSRALVEMARRLKIDRRVVFAGAQSEVLQCYHAADLFLMTSKYEPFGLVVLEALSCGLPIVTLPASGGVEELTLMVGETTSSTRDASRVREIVQTRIQEDSFEFRRMRHRRAQEQFSWEMVAKTVSRHYRQILQAHRPATMH